jgi:hypothetical protein
LTSPFALQAILLLLAGTGLGLLVVRLTRMRAISFRFTLAWAVIAGIGILAVPLIPLVEPIAAALAFSASALLTVAVSIVLTAIALQLSISVSRLGERTDELAIAYALAGEEDSSPHGSSPGADAVVVVPAYDEQATVGDVVRRARATGIDVVVVDDGSRDGTARVAAEAGAAVLRLPTNLGVGAALRTGFRYAHLRGYARVVQCDGDGQHAPEEIPRLLEEQRSQDVDLLIGSRFLTGADAGRPAVTRRFAMRLLARSASRAVGAPITDATSGFRVIATPLLEEFAAKLSNHYLGDTYEAVVAAGRAGFRVAEVPVPSIERPHGASTASALAATKFTVRVLAVVGLRAYASLRPAAASRTGS